MKRSLWTCAGLSLALHGALAIGWPPAPAPVAAASHGRAAMTLQAQLVARPSAPASRLPAPPAAPEVAPRPAAASAPEAAAVSATAPANGPTDGSTDEPAHQPTHQPISAAGQPAGVDGEATPLGPDIYLPRPQLTLAPSPREDILLDYPEDGPLVGHFVATLTLYIDEDGWVRRVDLDRDDALPAALHQAARASFGRARFAPGQVDGQAVKSRIRIEVVYESQALPPMPADARVAAAASPP